MQVKFAGIPAVLRTEFSMRQGVKPSTGRIAFVAEQNPPLFGDLWLSDGLRGVLLRNMHLVDPIVSESAGGRIIEATLADRRYTWKYGVVSGRYNMPDDATGRPAEQVTLQALLGYCFAAYGESPIFYEIPVAFPPVAWELENPATAIEELADKYALSVTLRLDGAVVVCPAQLPRLFPPGAHIEREVTYKTRLLPSSISIVGNRIIDQSYFAVEPVGVESSDQDDAGAIKPIDDLSYAPAGGWGKSILRDFADVPDGEKRDLARKTIFRWYGWIPTNVGNDTRAARLPWLNHIADTETVPTDELGSTETRRASPKVETVQTETDGVTVANSPYRATPTPYKIDNARGIVIFDSPVFKLAAGGVQAYGEALPATVTVTAAHELKTNDNVYYSDYYSYTVPVGGPLPPLVRHDKSLTLYSDNGTPDAAQKAELDAVAAKQAAEIFAGLTKYNPRQAVYAGIVPFDPYGEAKSVTYELSPGGIHTTISMGREEVRPFLPTYEERVQQKKTAALHWPTEAAIARDRQEREFYRR